MISEYTPQSKHSKTSINSDRKPNIYSAQDLYTKRVYRTCQPSSVLHTVQVKGEYGPSFIHFQASN